MGLVVLIFIYVSASKDWVELLNELALLAANASEQVHTPDNPAYDYVDNSRDSEVSPLFIISIIRFRRDLIV